MSMPGDSAGRRAASEFRSHRWQVARFPIDYVALMIFSHPVNTSLPLEARNEAAMSHLAGAFFVFLGPFLLWVFRRIASPFGLEALTACCNWQAFASVLLLLLLICFGWDMALFGLACNCAYGLLGAVASSRGHRFRYWVAFPWIQ